MKDKVEMADITLALRDLTAFRLSCEVADSKKKYLFGMEG